MSKLRDQVKALQLQLESKDQSESTVKMVHVAIVSHFIVITIIISYCPRHLQDEVLQLRAELDRTKAVSVLYNVGITYVVLALCSWHPCPQIQASRVLLICLVFLNQVLLVADPSPLLAKRLYAFHVVMAESALTHCFDTLTCSQPLNMASSK